ncbi:MAG: LPXTG cell wall anchor domain-containing protein, partial [Anaerotignaceae bacterium]
EYEGAEYIFIPGDSTVSVVVEKEGEDYVIRLIFVRNETTGGGGGGGGTTDPDPEPEPEPEPPTEVIPDTEIPGGDGEPGIIITPGTTDTTDATTETTPDTTTETTPVPETITIEDEETPLAMLPDIPAIIPEVPTMISEETIDIIEDEVPLGDAPQTGDNTKTKSFAIILVAAMAALLAMVTGKKRKEN